MPDGVFAPLTRQHVVVAALVLARATGTRAVVWPGHADYPLGLLDGTDGFRVTAESSTGRLGYSVAGAGDVDNDGFTDVIFGESPEFSSTAGAAYVIFGSETFSFLEIDVANLDGTNGFKIEGSDAGDFAGTSVAGAGDINGDGFDDILVGAWGASSAAGEILVVFGGEHFPAVVAASDLDGISGFVVRGATTSDASGYSVAAAGDVNNDGADDILIGAYRADPAGSMSGEAYIVFGSLSWTEESIDLGNLGTLGLTFEGGVRREYVGYSVAGAGDVNDDGFSDVIISAYGADEAYVFYGASTFLSTVYSLDAFSGTDGFIISAGNDGDVLVVAGAGDMNDDGYGDIAVGHSLADPDSVNSAGATYVILGGGAIESPVNVVTDLDGNNGFVLVGASSGDRSGTSVSGAGDINQDGYGDIVVGAPGVGNDAGAAYVVFGAETFSASYNLGSMGSAESFALTASSDSGYGGFSVSKTGDMNQDGFEDLVVGAYGAGTSGEAFVVFPHLTGTPPPSPSPTPAPTGPTPAPMQRSGATPSPTVNFLVDGVVGGGTVYEGPGVFVRAQELGGKVILGTDRWFAEDTRVSITLSSLHEKNAAGSLVGLGAAIPHVVDGGGLVYEATATTNVTLDGVAAQRGDMTTTILGGESTITVIMYVFEENGVVTNGDEQMEVVAGDLKVSLTVDDWPFCDPSTAPSRSTDDAPPTVCSGPSSMFETGAYLDATLDVQGPSSSTPVVVALAEERDEGDVVGDGLRYTMSGGSAEATLVMSEWVRTGDYGWTQAEEINLSDSSFTVRFPASSGTLYYDPTLVLVLVPSSDDGEFWRDMWFISSASALGLVAIICLVGFKVRRRRRVTKEKVSPGFEGVAPVAKDGSDNDGKGGIVASILRGIKAIVSCGCLQQMRPKDKKATPDGKGEKESSAVAGTRRTVAFASFLNKTAPSSSASTTRSRPRWRRKGSSVANKATSCSTSGGAGDDNTEAPSAEGLAASTPNWIKNLGGGAAGDNDAAAANETATENQAVPDWLAEAAGPAIVGNSGGGDRGDGAQQGYDDGYYGYDGYDGYEGYGYDGYYYDQAYYDQAYYAEGDAADATNGSIPAPTPPSGGGGGGGGGLSWLTNAASTVNTLNEKEDEEDGGAGAGGGATGTAGQAAGISFGATRLPPIGGAASPGVGGAGAMGTGEASMPWMAAR